MKLFTTLDRDDGDPTPTVQLPSRGALLSARSDRADSLGAAGHGSGTVGRIVVVADPELLKKSRRKPGGSQRGQYGDLMSIPTT